MRIFNTNQNTFLGIFMNFYNNALKNYFPPEVNNTQPSPTAETLWQIQSDLIRSGTSWDGRIPYRPDISSLVKYIESLGGELSLQVKMPSGHSNVYSCQNPQAVRWNTNVTNKSYQREVHQTCGNVLMWIRQDLIDYSHPVTEKNFPSSGNQIIQSLKEFAESLGGKMTLLVEKSTGAIISYPL